MHTYSSLNAARRGYARAYAPDSEFPGIQPTNTILDTVRDFDSGDPWGESSELLYALNRLWSEYQSPAMGTSPIDAYDAGDECAVYDALTEALEDVEPHEAARMIVHATKVAEHWHALALAFGRDY